MDFDDFLNDSELMNCHAFDETFESADTDAIRSYVKTPTLEDAPGTSWFDLDFLENNNYSSKKRLNSTPLPDAKRQKTDCAVKGHQVMSDDEVLDSQLKSMWDLLGSETEFNGTQTTENKSCDMSEADEPTSSWKRDDSKIEEIDEGIDGRELTEDDFEHLFESLGDALGFKNDKLPPSEECPKKPRFTVRMPGKGAGTKKSVASAVKGARKRFVGSNGAPTIFYADEDLSDETSVAEKLVPPPPPPPPHPVIRLKLKAVRIQENIQPSATTRKMILTESQSQKMKCTAEFFEQFLARKAAAL